MFASRADEFAEQVARIADPIQSVGPGAYYDSDGDCIEFLANVDEPFWAERIDDLVTVYYSEDTGEIIGSLIKGVVQFMEKYRRRAILVRDGKVKLNHLFLAGLFCKEADDGSVDVVTYEKKRVDVYMSLSDKAEAIHAVASVA